MYENAEGYLQHLEPWVMVQIHSVFFLLCYAIKYMGEECMF